VKDELEKLRQAYVRYLKVRVGTAVLKAGTKLLNKLEAVGEKKERNKSEK